MKFNIQNAFDHESAKVEGLIEPKKGVDEDYDAVLLELENIEKDLQDHLQELKKIFGPEVKYMNKAKRRYQVEIPESKLKKVSSDYELVAGGKKGVKRYLTPEGKVGQIFYKVAHIQ